MARVDFSGMDEFMDALKDITEIPDDVVFDMLNAEADVVIRAQKESIKTEGLVDTGQMLDSISRTNKLGKKNLERYMDVYPQGKRKDGVRNEEVAFINEYGAPKKHIKASKWMNKANEKCADEAVDAGAEVLDKFIKSKGL